MAHAATACDQCGQTDDHPKLHYGVETYHHDCIPARVRDDLGDVPRVAEIAAAAESGTHGDELRDLIANLHKED